MTTRNSNARFELAPQVSIERSTMDRSTNIKTSFDVGQLIPFFVDEVLPGDTFQITTSKVARLQTLITPVMDNLYLDTYYFFVPNRLVWTHWEEFCGANKTSAWYPDVEYWIPEIWSPVNGWNVGTIADYMGVPTGVETGDDGTRGINALPFRAYALICDEWFRDENLQDPLVINKGDTRSYGVNTGSSPADYALGGLPFVACKYHDYFTSALPGPLKAGADVPFISGYLPVQPYVAKTSTLMGKPSTPLFFSEISDGSRPTYNRTLMSTSNGSAVANETDDNSVKGLVFPDNLWASFGNAVNGSFGRYGANFSINSLRQAFQIQRILEKDARGGTRYIEILKAHFGVTSPDSRLQRPEYLGGNRVPFNIEQVLQTSSTNDTTPQGNVAGWSQTNDSHYDVEKSFTEHGYIIGLMCARYDHSYQQALDKMWSRKQRFDYYWPALAHLGEQAVLQGEIYWNGRNHVKENPSTSVFGYQEAWAEYRYKPNYITGQMRSQYAQSLDFWHFGDYYSQAPTLSAGWIVEDKANVDRTIAVSSDIANQIFIDVFVSNKVTRPMPLYSIPGLIDHF